MLSSLLDQKKRLKHELLLKSATELFLDKGAAETSIDEIVRRAGVAKGTFYLYFRDRNEILSHIVAEKSSAIVSGAFSIAANRSPQNSEQEIIFAVEEVIDRLQEDPRLLALIHKNLSWGMMTLMASRNESWAENLRRLAGDRSFSDFEKLAFMIIELVSSVAYSSIARGEPADIEEMKPILLGAVERLLS